MFGLVGRAPAAEGPSRLFLAKVSLATLHNTETSLYFSRNGLPLVKPLINRIEQLSRESYMSMASRAISPIQSLIKDDGIDCSSLIIMHSLLIYKNAPVVCRPWPEAAPEARHDHPFVCRHTSVDIHVAVAFAYPGIPAAGPGSCRQPGPWPVLLRCALTAACSQIEQSRRIRHRVNRPSARLAPSKAPDS